MLSSPCLWLFLAAGALTTILAVQIPARRLHSLGPQGVNLWKLEKLHEARVQTTHDAFLSQPFHLHTQGGDSDAYLDIPTKRTSYAEFEPQWFEQPLDHFSELNETDGLKWRQRYWVNTRHYKRGPVIVLDGGETNGEDRLPFLDTGIVEILAKATGGVGVILEHRYYGQSIPVENFSTDALRWLNNEQAVADSANFMANVKFNGIEEDLTAPRTPWIYYGGSYAGARAAHMRILHPELVYGAIASSAVTHAMIENWQYMEIIRNAADSKCSGRLQNAIKTIDGLLDYPHAARAIKSQFGVPDLAHNEDFVSLLQIPLGLWQAKVWDPNVGSTEFDKFCAALNDAWGFPVPIASQDLEFGHPDRLVRFPEGISLDFAILKYASWIKDNIISQCPPDFTHEDCFGTYDDTKFQDTNLDQDWRLWQFQVCTQWGYFSTAPPTYHPRIVSKLLTLEYESKICRQAYPPGEHFQVPNLPNVTAVNVLGDFYIAADRLAFIDGEVDPWLPNTPHSEYAQDREDTILRPFKLIPNGVHHYDEYGLRNISEEPPEIRQVHEEMISFVREWLKDWKAPN
ncbi:hypothetical protein AX15_003751 [Amanita polypyramis BW_CC]|nr:hypothetical protein AX15_003751 [Amanita polypyramis BW_CC]